jgi:hypothetical protein
VLRAFGEDLWIADGPPVRFLGQFDYPTRMAVVRLTDGGVWMWSPIAWSAELSEAVAAIGPVRHLVAPNKIHHLNLGPWAAEHPEARLWAAPGLARRRPDLTFHGELADTPAPAWSQDLDQLVFRGSVFMDEVVFFHRASRTALVCDLIQRFDPATLSGWRGALMRLDGLVGPEGSTPREWRASFLRRSAARIALQRALDWSPERLVIAHGDLPLESGRDALARGLRWLGPPG